MSSSPKARESSALGARRGVAAAALALLAGSGLAADRVVYKNIDASGTVSYSDRCGGEQDARVKNWMPAANGRTYSEAQYRADADRAYYARQQYERRVPPPIAVYDPLRWQAQRDRQATQPGYGYGRGYSGRRDFNLPETPAPSLERNYYYNGR